MEFTVQSYHRGGVPFFIFLMAKITSSSSHSMNLEKVIGLYELIKCNVRISLNPSTVNDIIFVKMNMPVTSQIDLRPIVWSFIQKVSKRKPKTFTPETTMKQQYFKAFFSAVPFQGTKTPQAKDDWPEK